MKELQVTIRSDGGSLTVTPVSLLNYFLPGAELVPEKPNVYKGKAITETGSRDVYLHVETMMGALMDCQKKHLNPITDVYVMPSNGPDKKSTYKIKYSVGIERARLIPGFLGLPSGLIVQRKVMRDGKPDTVIMDTAGLALPEDKIVGAWAEFFLAGLPKPIRHEVSVAQATGPGPLWKSRPAFMLMKVAVDELLRLKVGPMFAGSIPGEEEPGANEDAPIILEAQVPHLASPTADAKKSEPPAQPEWEAGTLYTGGIYLLEKVAKEKYGRLGVAVDGHKLGLFVANPALITGEEKWPEVVGEETWAGLIGRTACVSFQYSGTAKILNTFDLFPVEGEKEEGESHDAAA